MEAFSSTVASARAHNLVRAVATLLAAAVLLLTGQAAHASPLPNDMPASDSRLARVLLGDGLGGARDEFENNYGEPLDDDPQPYPVGYAYAIPEFGEGTAYAFFENDRLIHLSFVPANGTWTPTEVANLITDVVPRDQSGSFNVFESDETVISYSHSDSIGEDVGAEVYDAYDIAGEPGDFYTLFRHNDQGETTEIEFGLGTEVQDVESSDANRAADDDTDVDDNRDAGTSDAEAEYLAAVSDRLQTLTDSIDRFDALLQDPNLGDDDSVAELDRIFTAWITGYEDAKDLTPPVGYEEIHAAYLEFTGLLADAVMEFAGGDLVSAANALTGAEVQATLLSDLLQDATEPDFMDVKSGHIRR